MNNIHINRDNTGTSFNIHLNDNTVIDAQCTIIICDIDNDKTIIDRYITSNTLLTIINKDNYNTCDHMAKYYRKKYPDLAICTTYEQYSIDLKQLLNIVTEELLNTKNMDIQ